jgi:hypothetical protein
MNQMRNLISGLLVGLVLLVLMITLQPVKAEEGNAEEAEKHTQHHRIELFLGDTFEDGEHDFSPGLTYEYRPISIFGVGAFWEFSHKKFDKFGIPLFIHPYKGFRFVLAPGLNYVGEDDRRFLFLFRTGIGYEFEIGRWSITPEINYDFVEEDENPLVFGVSIGFGF